MRKYPSLLLLGFATAGILVSDALRLPAAIFAASALISAAAGLWLFLRYHGTGALWCFATAIIFFTAASFGSQVYERPSTHIDNRIVDGGRYHMFGRVADWPEFRGNFTEITLEVDSLGADRTVPAQGKVLLKVSDSTTAFQRGDRLELWARLYKRSGESRGGRFDYDRYLALRGISAISYLQTTLPVRVDRSRRSEILRWIDDLRVDLKEVFNKTLTPESAALALGFLIGETRDISPDVYQHFRDSGTLHLLAVSGSNVAVVLLCFVFILRWTGLSTRVRSGILFAIIAIFALLSYGEPSVVRASVMASLVLLARLVERRYDANNLIAAAGLIILLVAPTQLFDVGFQLSFVTAWGLILGASSLDKVWGEHRHRWYYVWIVVPIVLTITAQLFSTPLIMFYFRRLPMISVLANLAIVPLVSVDVAGVLLVLVAYFILPPLGSFAGAALQPVMNLTLSLLAYFGDEKSIILHTPPLHPLGVIILLICTVLLVKSVATSRGRRRMAVALFVAVNILLALALVRSLAPAPYRTARVAAVPGGAMVLVTGIDMSYPDLVITGIARRDYPIDERIITPWLRSAGIEKINRMVLFQADFDAVDDVVRCARLFGAKEICVPEALKPVLTDAVDRFGALDSTELVSLGTSFPNDPLYGCNGLCLSSTTYRLTDQTAPLLITLSAASFEDQSGIVIFDPAKNDVSFWDDIDNNSQVRGVIICANIDHPSDSPSESRSIKFGSPQILFLDRVGELSVEWVDSLSQPILNPEFN